MFLVLSSPPPLLSLAEKTVQFFHARMWNSGHYTPSRHETSKPQTSVIGSDRRVFFPNDFYFTIPNYLLYEVLIGNSCPYFYESVRT
jgi:hypothetical protein